MQSVLSSPGIPCVSFCRLTASGRKSSFLVFLVVSCGMLSGGCADTSSNRPDADAKELYAQASDSSYGTTISVDSNVTAEGESAVSSKLLAGLQEELPQLKREDSYVGSDACRECHPNEHASWHKSYHRTMTQIAVPGNVLGDFSNQTIESAGLRYRVYRRGDEYWAEMPDPDRMLDYARGDPNVDPQKLPLVKRRVVMTTGSHHYQTYWVGHNKFDTVLNTLPLVYLPQQERWIPRESAFISPPNDPHRMITIWNDHCINCHSTGGNPGLKGPKTLLTSVGELGISCEACHGPGENHVAKYRELPLNPNSESRTELVNPAELDHVRSSQVCGQCHGVFVRRGKQGMKFAREGIQFRPGENLLEYRHYIQFPQADSPASVHAAFRANREFFRERWWDDGTILAGGREYTAMQGTKCFTQGEMSCLSCHSLHNSDPNDQLKDGMRGNLACTQCHSEERFTTNVQAHTHHQKGATGSECMNCHMPHTSYALFKGIRNHTVRSPSVKSSLEHGVPNACNLCHLDKTLEWTQRSLVDWYGHEPLEMDSQQTDIAASVIWLLKGDAAKRAVVAWHYGWEPAQQVSGVDWMANVLAYLLVDPYGVVRRIAEVSTRTLPSMSNWEYDFLAKRDELKRSASAVLARGQQRLAGFPSAVSLNRELINNLIGERDNRPVSVKE